MKVCFVADLPAQTLGGSEMQSYMIATGLAARGWEVAYVIGFGERHTRELPEVPKGLTVYEVDKNVIRGSELPRNWWLKRYMRGLSLLRILLKVNPDFLLVSLGGSIAGFVASYSIFFRKKLVYRAGNRLHADLTFGRADLLDFGFVARHLHLFAVMNTDLIVTNANHVAAAFKRSLPGKLVQVIPNGVDIHPIPIRKKERHSTRVLWLGRMEKVKNPEVFVKLAASLPRIRFVMCGSGRLFAQMAKVASNVQNINIGGLVTGEKKLEVLESAVCLVNTSITESFPNTLLEAGLYGVPYVSFVDPDEVICRYTLGFHVTSFQQLVEKIELLWQDTKLRSLIGNNIRRYVEQNHDIEKSILEYDRLLRSLR